jgi:hypothetical protein
MASITLFDPQGFEQVAYLRSMPLHTERRRCNDSNINNNKTEWEVIKHAIRRSLDAMVGDVPQDLTVGDIINSGKCAHTTGTSTQRHTAAAAAADFDIF